MSIVPGTSKEPGGGIHFNSIPCIQAPDLQHPLSPEQNKGKKQQQKQHQKGLSSLRFLSVACKTTKQPDSMFPSNDDATATV
jgi:hypothetical protein